MRSPSENRLPFCTALTAIVVVVGGVGLLAQAPEFPPASTSPIAASSFVETLREAMVRLPLAALLGTALALRPKRRGTPKRTPAVVETQIILAVVGALIMLVVGASLARAFGIVGAANLIRYRSKIDDPKDAVVMLSALAVGLAAGVGLYGLGIFGTAFLVAALWVIESFEPTVRKAFALTIRLGAQTDARRGKIEAILRRYGLKFELRTTEDEQVSYDVKVPLEAETKAVTDAVCKLDSTGHASVQWEEKKEKSK